MTEYEHKVIVAMMKQLGAPYRWAGKGDILWTPTKPEPLYPTSFDCCGLVEWGLLMAGGSDRRLLESAPTQFATWKPVPSAASLEARPLAAFYGSETHISHVGLMLSLYGSPWLLEASGGDQTTTSLQEAQRRNACVRFGPPRRTDFRGFRYLPEGPRG